MKSSCLEKTPAIDLQSQTAQIQQATVAISPKFAIRAVQSPAHRAPELTAAPQALAAKERYEAIQLMEVMKPATP